MLHAKFQDQRTFGFLRFQSYKGAADILIIWPGSLILTSLLTFVPPSQGDPHKIWL